MARTKKRKPQRVPAYSGESLAVRLICGLLLLALGVLIFLACDLSMSGTIFEQLRRISRGLTGAMSTILAILPVWGGILMVVSAQKKAPIKYFLLGLTFFLLITNCVTLVSSVDRTTLMAYYQGRAGLTMDYGKCLSIAYDFSFRAGGAYGGGLIGALLAWPLWIATGSNIPGAVLLIALALVNVWFLIPKKTRTYVTGQIKASQQEHREMAEAKRAQVNQEEIAWQQAQAARMMQAQQQQQPQPNGYNAWQPAPNMQPVRNEPGFGFPQTTAEHSAIRRPGEKKPGFVSRILNNLKTDVPETESRASRIVGEPEQPGYGMPQYTANQIPPMPPQPGMYPGGYPQTAPVPPQPAAAQQPFQPARPPIQPAPAFTPAPEQPHDPDQPDPRIRTVAPTMPTAPVKPIRPEPAVQPEPEKPKTEWQKKLEEKLNKQAQPEPAFQPLAKLDTPLKPKESWSNDAERPPWEEPPQTPETVVMPHVNDSKYQPKLDIKQTEDKTFGAKEEEKHPHIEIPYVYPELDLLQLPKPQVGINPEDDAARSAIIEETLASFKIPAQVHNVTHGPAISRFELSIQDGIKVGRVSDLHQNIAMKLAVKGVRIEAPIPGKSLVGIEVPNREKANVTLREVLESDQMRGAKSSLTVALGKDIAGTPVVCDLAKMPHLLIAGSTGSGKSVCINTIINSLLYRCSPKEVRLILVDPKVVELNCYNGVPHLLLPVVSNPKKAAGALAWAVEEMMDRYGKFREKGVRNIEGYNNALTDSDEFMPRIVIIIDELADLMMTCKREVEDHIVRLAQLARAAGIHMIVATQRPSVDVITGLIKANIPSRIAFKVSSYIDSRTILDKQGAESLLGWGDMLYLPTGADAPLRIQGCFLSDQEVNDITDFIRTNSPAEYDPNIMEQLDKLLEESSGPDPADALNGSSDEVTTGDGNLLAQCVEMAVNDGQISTSLIQRRLRVGYARAGRLVDELEKRGILSAKDGAKPRMCLISREEYEQMLAAGNLEE